jgi:hypothetical protein
MLYEIPVGGWHTGQQRYLKAVDANSAHVVTGRGKQILEDLLRSDGDRVWDYFDQLRPGLLEAVLVKKQHQVRAAALRTFEQRLTQGD